MPGFFVCAWPCSSPKPLSPRERGWGEGTDAKRLAAFGYMRLRPYPYQPLRFGRVVLPERFASGSIAALAGIRLRLSRLKPLLQCTQLALCRERFKRNRLRNDKRSGAFHPVATL